MRGTKADGPKDSRFQRKAFIGLLALAVLSPLGIILPKAFHSEGPFGEWGPEYFGRALGYVPEGIKRGVDLWHAPAQGYTFLKDACFVSQLLFYVASGLLGLLLAGLLVFLLARMGRRDER